MPNRNDSGASYCDCYGEPEGTPLCDECAAEERERDEQRAADLFAEDLYLYSVPLRAAVIDGD